MNGRRFDALTKTFAASMSRRQLLKALAGSAAGGVFSRLDVRMEAAAANEVVLPSAGTVTVTAASADTSCDAEFGIAAPISATIFSPTKPHLGESVRLGPFGAGTNLEFWYRPLPGSVCATERYLSSDPTRAQVQRLGDEAWRIGWEDWNDADFDDFAVDVSLNPAGCPPGGPDCPEIDYFALGDSIASGHGLMDPDGPDPAECCREKEDTCRTNPRCCQTCRRSEKAYPHKVRDFLQESGYKVVTFNHLACTGATAADHGNPNLPRYKWLRHQVDDVLAGLSIRPTLVSITAGANDFEWASPGEAQHRFAELSDADFATWVDQTSSDATTALRHEIFDRLLAKPNVVVVITDVYNPFNKESWLWTQNPISAFVCSSQLGIWIPTQIAQEGPHYQSCYGRADYGVTLLNTSYLALVGEHQRRANQTGDPARLAIAQVRRLFQGRESPQGAEYKELVCGRGGCYEVSRRLPCCGDAAPEIADTWIQHRYDAASNSQPCLDGEWSGDCFHPNEEGARQIAMQVQTAALPLLAGLAATGAARPPITSGSTPQVACAGDCTPTHACCAGICEERPGSCCGDRFFPNMDCCAPDHPCTDGGTCCPGTDGVGPCTGFDPANCGACGTACAANEFCCEGACYAAERGSCCGQFWPGSPCCIDNPTQRPVLCPAGLTCCIQEHPRWVGVGPCVDLLADSAHCGGCDRPCASGQVCQGGACVPDTIRTARPQARH